MPPSYTSAPPPRRSCSSLIWHTPQLESLRAPFAISAAWLGLSGVHTSFLNYLTMAALASNGNGSTEKVEKAMENMSVNEPAKALETVIGIDLGTTFSCVAVWDEAAGRPVVLTNSTGAKTMPSYVSFTDQARVVGQPAKSQAASNPANTVYDVKRIIGRSWNDQVRQHGIFEFFYFSCSPGHRRSTPPTFLIRAQRAFHQRTGHRCRWQLGEVSNEFNVSRPEIC